MLPFLIGGRHCALSNPQIPPQPAEKNMRIPFLFSVAVSSLPPSPRVCATSFLPSLGAILLSARLGCGLINRPCTTLSSHLPRYHAAPEELQMSQPLPSYPSILTSRYYVCPSPVLGVQLQPRVGKDESPWAQAVLFWLLLNALGGDFHQALLT